MSAEEDTARRKLSEYAQNWKSLSHVQIINNSLNELRECDRSVGALKADIVKQLKVSHKAYSIGTVLKISSIF